MTAAKKPTGPPAATLDLDAALAELDLSPITISFAGQVYAVRRDLTAPERVDYWARAAAKDDAGCLGIIVGDEALGVSLNAALEKLPHQAMMLALKKIMTAAELIEDSGEAQGESSAS